MTSKILSKSKSAVAKRRIPADNRVAQVPKSETFSIFNFFDYRQYLQAYYAYRKGLNLRFSYRAFASKLGVNSSGLYLSLVQGKQNMTPALVEKFIPALGLTRWEADYFRMMVDFTHASSAEAKQFAFDSMVPLLPPQARVLAANQRDYYRNWYHVAVREALAILDVRDDFAKLGAFLRPALDDAQVREALRVLSGLGLVCQDAKGRWVAADRSISVGIDVDAMLVHQFQGQMMNLAKKALEHTPPDKRNISCVTVSVSRQGYERINRKVEQFRREIREIVRSDREEENVYQLNVQLFPLSDASGTRRRGSHA